MLTEKPALYNWLSTQAGLLALRLKALANNHRMGHTSFDAKDTRITAAE
jgi:hypothetical protein